MRFGLFYEWPNPGLENWQTLFEQGIEQIRYSEQLGFDFVLIAEHHFSTYGQSPAPLLEALHIAHRTERITIATAALVLPLWQPLRLAEEVAVLDNLTGGRFICGIGRGYQPHEMLRHGVTVEESRARFDECLDIMRLAWTENTSFTYEGQYLSVPHPTVVWPKPLQKPYPPLWVAGTSPDTIRFAAEHDAAPISAGFYGPTGIRDAAALLVKERIKAGRPPGPFDFGIQAVTHVAPTDDIARERMSYARWQNRAGRSLLRHMVVDGQVQPNPYEGEPDDEGLWRNLFYGSPETVTAKLRPFAASGVSLISLWMMKGGMPHDLIMESIKLMGEQVIPALRDEHPPADLLDQLAAAAVQPEAIVARGPAPSD